MTEKEKVKEEGGDVASRKDRRQRSADWSFPESPLDLACTFLLIGLRFGKLRGPVLIGWLGGRFVDALLHPLHDQVQQRYHRLVHLRSRRGTRLKVRDPVSHNNRSVCWKGAQQQKVLEDNCPNNPSLFRFISTGSSSCPRWYSLSCRRLCMLEGAVFMFQRLKVLNNWSCRTKKQTLNMWTCWAVETRQREFSKNPLLTVAATHDDTIA